MWNKLLGIRQKFDLKFPNKIMEKEFVTLKQQTNIENIHVTKLPLVH